MQSKLKSRIPDALTRGSIALWFGLVVLITGITWDRMYHARGGGHEGTIPPGHLVTVLGAIVVLLGAGLAWRRAGRFRKCGLGGVFLFGGSYAVGSVWHDWMHLQGGEASAESFVHVLVNYGLLGLLASVLVVAAMSATARFATADASEQSDGSGV